MNLTSHLMVIQNEILESLAKNKELMIPEILSITKNVGSLLKIDCYSFIENRIGTIDWHEIPITLYAVKHVTDIWKNITPNKKEFSRVTYIMLEKLFTFWKEDDLCKMQGQFYYLKDKTTEQVFCESEFGETRFYDQIPNGGNCMIASISELLNQGIIDSKNERLLLK